jgi:hypothetical protein
VDVGQWWRAFLAGIRPWVLSLAPQETKTKKTKNPKQQQQQKTQSHWRLKDSMGTRWKQEGEQLASDIVQYMAW